MIGTHYSHVGAPLIWFSFFWHRPAHVRNECFIQNAACFHFLPHCHGDSPSKSSPIEIPGRIWCNCHTAGLSYLSPPPFFCCWEGGEKSCLKIIKCSLIKHGVWENVRKVMRVRAIWLCFYGNRTNLSSVCHLFYRIGRRSRLRPVPSSASSVCHLEPGCRKTLVLCVLEMMSMCVIIINRIKLYCQTRVTWLSCVKVPFACLQDVLGDWRTRFPPLT